MKQLIGAFQDRVLAPSKQLFTNYKEPFSRIVSNKTTVDSTRLINENEEVDELDVRRSGKPQDSNLYSYEAAGLSTARNKALLTVDRCPCCACCWKRWQVAILAGIGFTIAFGIRCNFGAARGRMSKLYNDSQGVQHSPEFNWTAVEFGAMESSFFYGYLITQLPGGLLAAKFPPNKLFGLAIGSASLLNLLIPGACKAGVGVVMLVQALQGLVQGVSYPAMHGVWRYWAPPMERSKLATTALTGSYAGAVIGLPLSAFLVTQIYWSAPFYLYGIAGIIWMIFWYMLTFEKPALHPTITEEEKVYIETQIGHVSQLQPKFSNIPWKAILTSKPVWAIIVANFARSWTFYLLLIHQLTYMRDVLHMKIEESGMWAAAPHLVMAVIVLIGGQLADYLRVKNILSTTTVRKLFNCGGFGGEALFLLVVGYTKNRGGAITALILAVGCSGFAISGFNVNHLDIAPRYASILMGMSNGMGTLSGMICPFITEKLKAAGRWETVFLVASMIHFTGVTFYAVFASGELQDWAEPPEELETWKPDDFASKAHHAGLGGGGGYGATESVGFPALPTTEELVQRQQNRAAHPPGYFGNGPQAGTTQGYEDFHSNQDNSQSPYGYTQPPTGVSNEFYQEY